MRRRMAARRLVVLGLTLSLGTGMVRADQEARVTRVEPALEGGQVVCRLTTAGLPGERLLQSMRSGLVSEIAIEAALLNEREKIIGGHRLSLRLAFDLWEEVFSVSGGEMERRFADQAALAAYLDHLDPLPVAPARALNPAERYQVIIGVEVQAIAADDHDRVGDAIAGEQRPRREGEDQQEASVSLGRLIRFFYAGSREGAGGLEARSPWFTLKELDHGPH